MCWWPCCGGWVTTRHYEINSQQWKKDHGANVYAVATRDGKIYSGGELAPFSHVHEIRFTLNGEPTSGTFDLVWGEETIGTGISITLTAAELEALLDAAEIEYIEITGGPLNTDPIIVRFKDSVVTPPSVSFENGSFTGGDEPEISIDYPQYACRRYSAAGSLEETWHEEIVYDIDIGTATGELIYLADGGIHVYGGDLATVHDVASPWSGETVGGIAVDVVSAETLIATHSRNDWSGASNVLVYRTDSGAIETKTSPTGFPINAFFDPDGNLVVLSGDAFISGTTGNTIFTGTCYITKFSTTGEKLWEHEFEGNGLAYPAFGSLTDKIFYQFNPGSPDNDRLVCLNADGTVNYDAELPDNNFVIHGAGESTAIHCPWFSTAHWNSSGSVVTAIDLTDGSEISPPADGIDPARFTRPVALLTGGLQRAPDGEILWGNVVFGYQRGDIFKGTLGKTTTLGSKVFNHVSAHVWTADRTMWKFACDSNGNLFGPMFFIPVKPFVFFKATSNTTGEMSLSHTATGGEFRLSLLKEVSATTPGYWSESFPYNVTAEYLNDCADNNTGAGRAFEFSGGPLDVAPITIEINSHDNPYGFPSDFLLFESAGHLQEGGGIPDDFLDGDKKCFYLNASFDLVEVPCTEPDWVVDQLQSLQMHNVAVDNEDRIWGFTGLKERQIVVKNIDGDNLDAFNLSGSRTMFPIYGRVEIGRTIDKSSDGRFSILMLPPSATGNTLQNTAPKFTTWNSDCEYQFGHVFDGVAGGIDHDADGYTYGVTDISTFTGKTRNLISWDGEGIKRWERYHGADLRACKVVGESLYVGGDLSIPIYLELFGTKKYASLRVTESSDSGEWPTGTFDLNFFVDRSSPTPDLDLDLEDIAASITANDLEDLINDLMDDAGESYVVSVTGGPLSSGEDFDLVWDQSAGPTITIPNHKLSPTYTIRRYELDGTFVCGFGNVPVNSIDAISEELIIAAGEVGNSGLKIEMTQDGDGSNNCIQTLTRLQPLALSFRLLRGEAKSTALAHDISATDLQTALEDISSIGTGNVSCSGGPLDSAPIEIEFIGDLELMAISLLEIESKDEGTTRRYTGAGVLQKVWNHKAEVHSAWVDRDDPDLFETGGDRVQE